MGHDISGYNKAREEIAYARFSMGNYNSTILYSLLDADKYFAGVSGCGASSTFSIQQIEKALTTYNQLFGSGDNLAENNWDLKQILTFMQDCLTTAQKEGDVSIYFG